MQKEPESIRSPRSLRIPSASPVSSDSSMVRPREATTRRRRQLIAGLDPDDVAGDDLVGAQLEALAVADHLGPRGDEQREVVERLLRLDLLADPDRRVDDRDHPEERVRPEPLAEDEDEEDEDDPVEERQDVREHDRAHRAARVVLGRAEPLRAGARPRPSSAPSTRLSGPRAIHTE